MIINIEKSKSITAFKKAIKELENQDNIKSILILSCEANNYTPKNTDVILKKIKKPIFGGIFPQIINGKNKMTQGSLFIGFEHNLKTLTVPVPDTQNERYDKLLEFSERIIDSKTMFIFLDGFTKGITNFLDEIFNVIGLQLNYFGGGAGSLEKLTSSPCLFSNYGLLQNKAMLVAFDGESSVGVKHGWNSISTPVQITESFDNTIKAIDWRPAFDVYKEIVEEHSGQKINVNNFFDKAKAYPFGISKHNNEMVVRDPIITNANNEIVCVGEVPQNSIVNILNGNNSSLIGAAEEACDEAKKMFNDKIEQKCLFVIDCISRVLFLEDDFQKELMAMYSDDYPLFGIISIGEIANNGDNFLEFYNKTIVAAFIECKQE